MNIPSSIRRLPEAILAYWQRSIRRQLTIGFGAAALVFVLASGHVLHNQQRDALYREGLAHATALANALAKSSVSWVLANDLAGLQEVLSGLSGTVDLTRAFILMPNGEVLASTRTDEISLFASDPISHNLLKSAPVRHVLADQPNMIDVAVPVMAGNHHVGWARVELTRDSANTELRRLAQFWLALTLIAVLLMVLVALALARGLTKGLNHLIEVTSEVGRGHNKVRANIRREDEVGALARDFNRMLDALAHKKALLRGVIDSTPDLIFFKDLNGLYLGCNQAFAEYAGRPERELIGKADFNFLDQETAQLFRDKDRIMLETDHAVSNEEWITYPDGRRILLDTLKTPFRDADGRILGLVGISRDITERKANEVKIQRLSRFYAALSHCNEAIVRCTSEDELFQQVCRAAVEFGGLKMAWIGLVNPGSRTVRLADCFGNGADEYLAGIEISVDTASPFGFGPTGTAIRENQPVWCQDFQHDPATAPWHERGARLGFLASASLPLLRNGVTIGAFTLYADEVNAFEEDVRALLVEIAADISYALDNFALETERKQAEERIQWLAHFDVLTGLPNRALFTDRINHAIRLAQRTHTQLAILFLDLDHFKNINDTLGHRIGDQLLIAVAKRLKSAVRDEDTISRQGGDEFILVLPGTDANGAAHVAEKLLMEVAQSCQIEQHELVVTPSIGITIYPNDGEDFEALSQRADVAMYRAKQEGRNKFCFYTSEMQARSARNLQLENALRRALERDQLQLHYQPQISLENGHVIGVEALLRWQHPELGAISPAEFIPIAEDSGLILPIGEWVLRTAVGQMKAWMDAGLSPMVIAVNLSAVQFRHHNLPELVSQILEELKLPPQHLELELTEGVAMGDPLAAIAVMDDLHERGIRMSIDDFGTGYSSLSYLKRFQVYKLKIDQSLVRDITEDPEDRAIISAIISLASGLGMQTIAEGVETEGQLAFLREKGCNEVQGYHFSRPLPAEQFEAFVRGKNGVLASTNALCA
jgi:diguanylate cyclase (GGDEF)-like protein/PAS domain S-box-containing protein